MLKVTLQGVGAKWTGRDSFVSRAGETSQAASER